MAIATDSDVHANSSFMYLMTRKIKSDGLGGFLGVMATADLGVKKQITLKHIHMMIVPLLILVIRSQASFQISTLSLILALQRSNEAYRNIQLSNITKLSPSYSNSSFVRTFIRILFYTTLLMWLLNLLLVCGDIHSNPGPDSVSSQSELSSAATFELLSNHLSIFHLNIQSLLPKIDIVRCEAEAYDVCFFLKAG